MSESISHTNAQEGRITPELLTKWFEEAFVALDTPEEVRQEMRHFLEMDACIWLCSHGELSHTFASEVDMDGNPINQSIRDVQIADAADYVFEKLESWPGWIEECPCGPILHDEFQYYALELGYKPGWECRYATFTRHGIFYLYRSGEVLYKFCYTKMTDTHWEMTSCFRTAKVTDTSVLEETLRTGHWRTSLVEKGDR